MDRGPRATDRRGTSGRGDPGPVLAEGRSAVVHDLGGGRVLRRYRDPRADTGTEADLMSLAAAHGVPVPRVFDADGPDLVLERVDGPSMLDALRCDPGTAAVHGRTLAELHRSLDGVPGPSGRLLHGDLHPGNVLLAARGPVLVDWTNAGWGPGPHDVATTWLVLACFDPHLPPTAGSWDVVRRPLLEAFLAATDAAAAAAAVPDVAARRLADPGTTPPERALIRALADVTPWRR